MNDLICALFNDAGKKTVKVVFYRLFVLFFIMYITVELFKFY